MDDFKKNDLEEALQAIASMISRTGKAKFAHGTSQHTLQTNRLKALNIASSLIANELKESTSVYTKDDLEKAVVPLASLISKSEKARAKLAHGTWQHTMLSNNLEALYIALPLLKKALNEKSTESSHVE